MGIREAHKAMIRAINGGWEVAAAALGMTLASLENRIYERKGQTLSTADSLALQATSGTTMFAEAIAHASGGTFVKLPECGEVDNEALLIKFNALHAELGLLSRRFGEYTKDDEINAREATDLKAIGDEVHKTMEELLALTFKIYCHPAPIKSTGNARAK